MYTYNPFSKDLDFSRHCKGNGPSLLYGFLDLFSEVIYQNKIPSPTTVLTGSGGSGELQSAINSASSGDVLVVRSNIEYSPIVIPANKNLSIFVDEGYSAAINANNTTYCVAFQDQAQNVIISGFALKNQQGSNTPGAVDNAGAVCLNSPALVKNIVLKDLTVFNCSEAGIQFQRQASATTAPSSEEDLCRNIWIINCELDTCSTVDSTENGAIAFYDAKDVYILNNKCSGSLRGIMCSNTVDVFIGGNWIYNNRYEGIKLDTVASNQFPFSRAFVFDNLVWKNATLSYGAGIRADDRSACIIVNNTVVQNNDGGILVEDNSDYGLVANNICYDNVGNGVETEDSIQRVLVLNNISYASSLSNFNLGTDTPSSITNIEVDPKFTNVNDPLNGGLKPSMESPAWFFGYRGLPIGCMSQERDLETLIKAWDAKSVLFTSFYSVMSKFENMSRSGTVQFSNQSSSSVVFDYPLPDANYSISITPSFSSQGWYSNKTNTGFTINFSSNVTGTVDWSVDYLSLG